MVSNRPEKIAYAFQGTRGAYEADIEKRVWIGDDRTLQTNSGHRSWQDVECYSELLGPELTKELADASSSGHGGSDYMTGRRFAQAITGVRPPEITAKDSLDWTVAGLLSQQSILEGSRPIQVLLYS